MRDTEFKPIENSGPGRIAIIPRPRGGDWLGDDLARLKRGGVDVLVSLLEESEQAEVGLEREGECCQEAGLRYISFPIRDRGVPSSALEFLSLVESIRKDLAEGKSVAIHCRMGIGRSSLLAAAILVRGGIAIEEAWSKVQAARGCPVPDTREQRDWVMTSIGTDC